MAFQVHGKSTLSGLDVFNEIGALANAEDKGTHNIEPVGKVQIENIKFSPVANRVIIGGHVAL